MKIHKITFLFLILILVIFLDLYSKNFVLNNIDSLKNKNILFFIDINLSCNKGISFSFFKNLNLNFIIFFIGIIILFFTIYVIYEVYTSKKNNNFFIFICYSMILGGGYSNLIDRFQNGCVIDFLDLHIKDFHFFIFNIADFFISFGFIFIILINLLNIKKVN